MTVSYRRSFIDWLVGRPRETPDSAAKELAALREQAEAVKARTAELEQMASQAKPPKDTPRAIQA